MNLEQVAFVGVGVVLVASGLASALVRRTFHSVMFLGVFLVAVAGLYVLLGSPLVGVIQILVYVGGILTLFVFAVMFVAEDEKDEAAPAPPPRARSPVWSTLAALAVALGVLVVVVQFTMTANHAVSGLLGGHNVASADGKTVTWTASDLANIAGWVAGLAFIAVAAVAGIVAWLGIRHALDQWSGARIFGTTVAALLTGLVLAVAAKADPWGGAAATDASVAAANDLDSVLGSLFGAQAIALEILGVLLTAVMIGALVLARPLGAVEDADRYSNVTPDQVRESQMASDVALHAEVPE